MINIINLIKKEFLTLNFFQPRYLLASILGIIYVVFFPEFIIFPYYMLTMLIVINSFYTYESSKGEYLTYSLPISSKDYIISRYIFSLISIFTISLIISIATFIGPLIGKTPIFSTLSTFLIGLGISLLMTSIITPLIIKFGYKNISAINIVVTLLIAFGGNFLISNLPQIISIDENILALIISLISIFIFFISLITSIFICKKKELLN